MRELTTLPNAEQARRLASYMAVQGIQASAEEDEGQWILWYHDDDDRERATQILAEFEQNPKDSRYEVAERKVRSVFLEADRLQKEVGRDQKRLEKRSEGSWWHCYPATYITIGLCVVVAILCTDWRELKNGPMGPQLCNKDDSGLLSMLGVATPVEVVIQEGRRIESHWRNPAFPQEGLTPQLIIAVLKGKISTTIVSLRWTMAAGEFWRPVTPIFLHFGLLHILFNMMWLRATGTAIEYTRGTRRFLILCLILAVTSNIGQLFWAGPNFGGMSGVVFGLIGYVWMKGRTQPKLGIGLEQRTIVMAIFWLILCMTGALGNIANAAHLVGFIVGIVIGGRQAIWKKIPFTK